MRKTLTLSVLCAAFGFALGRMSVTRSKSSESESPFGIGSELVVDRPERISEINPDTAYKSQRLQVFSWRGRGEKLGKTPNERPAWRIAFGGRQYVAAPID